MDGGAQAGQARVVVLPGQGHLETFTRGDLTLLVVLSFLTEALTETPTWRDSPSSELAAARSLLWVSARAGALRGDAGGGGRPCCCCTGTRTGWWRSRRPARRPPAPH